VPPRSTTGRAPAPELAARLLDAGDVLEHGQLFMRLFVLEDFAVPEHLTLSTPVDSAGERLFGTIRITYWARAIDPEGTRLLVKVRVAPPRGVFGRAKAWLLPWGNLVMMRKQLVTLRDLAEASARDGALRGSLRC
jgi:hypothetical protein